MRYRQGDILFNRYRIEGLLGTGAYADVYLVTHLNLGVTRALKCISNQQYFAIARQEADILKNLRHPAIPIIYDIEETKTGIGIIEEYVEGHRLDSLIFPHNTISYRDVIRYAGFLCDAVRYLHEQGICHYDIKPKNIIITEAGVKLMDYGSAAYQTDETEESLHRGTLGYAAPEMYERKKTGESADIYSLGMVLLAMAAGGVTDECIEKVPQNLREVISRCIHHTEQERYQSLAQLQNALKVLGQLQSPSSYSIHFAGISPHCGTTHALIQAALYYKRHKESVLMREHNDHEDFRRLVRVANRMTFQSGILVADGLSYLPNYRGLAMPAVSDRYTRILYDEGVVSENNLIMPPDGTLCLVTTAAPSDLDRLEEWIHRNRDLIKEAPGGIHILFNLCSGVTYRKAVRRLGIGNSHRIPYSP